MIKICGMRCIDNDTLNRVPWRVNRSTCQVYNSMSALLTFFTPPSCLRPSYCICQRSMSDSIAYMVMMTATTFVGHARQRVDNLRAKRILARRVSAIFKHGYQGVHMTLAGFLLTMVVALAREGCRIPRSALRYTIDHGTGEGPRRCCHQASSGQWHQSFTEYVLTCL